MTFGGVDDVHYRAAAVYSHRAAISGNPGDADEVALRVSELADDQPVR
jgi:hypothetical protein